MGRTHDVSENIRARVRRDFPPAQHAAAIATLARIEAGDEEILHDTLLRVADGNLITLKTATWEACRDWRDLMVGADAVDRNRERERDAPPGPPESPPLLEGARAALFVAVERLRWAETFARWPDIGSVFVEHGDRAAILDERGGSFEIVYYGLDASTPEGESFEEAEIEPLLAVVGRWLRDGGHWSLDDPEAYERPHIV